MLSRAQIILIKQAQREAGLEDGDYREAIATVSGIADCRSAKDGRLTDEHFDGLMSYFEAIYWRAADAPRSAGGATRRVFRAKGYWANRNRKGNTSRDRFTEKQLMEEVLAVENRLMGLGCTIPYLQGIQNRIRPFSLVGYLGALRRTERAKCRAKVRKELEPF